MHACRRDRRGAPTVVDNENMYNSCGTVSSIEFGSSESQSLKTEHSTRWGHTNLAGFDNYGAPFASFSIMGGGGYEVTKTKREERPSLLSTPPVW